MSILKLVLWLLVATLGVSGTVVADESQALPKSEGNMGFFDADSLSDLSSSLQTAYVAGVVDTLLAIRQEVAAQDDPNDADKAVIDRIDMTIAIMMSAGNLGEISEAVRNRISRHPEEADDSAALVTWRAIVIGNEGPSVVSTAGAYGRAYPGVGLKHWVKEKIDGGRSILLEDNSLWEVSVVDRIHTAIWLPYQDVIVKPTNNGYVLISGKDQVSVTYLGKQ